MLHIGDDAPQFALPDQTGATRSLSDYAGRTVLLYWYPKADTPGCVAQAQSLRDQQAVFDRLDCAVLGASFDPVPDLAAFADRYRLGFPLLSDPERTTGQAYGVAGADGTATHAHRIAYLISPDGNVRATYEVDDPEFFADLVLDDLETTPT